MKLTNHFSLSEFNCRDGSETPQRVIINGTVYYPLENLKEVAENLEVLREYLGTPITVNSGFRTVTYNKKVGGAPNSQHLRGRAADIRTAKYTPAQVHAAIEKLISEGKMKQGGLGIYNSFCHYDVRGVKARWDERTK